MKTGWADIRVLRLRNKRIIRIGSFLVAQAATWAECHVKEYHVLPTTPKGLWLAGLDVGGTIDFEGVAFEFGETE